MSNSIEVTKNEVNITIRNLETLRNGIILATLPTAPVLQARTMRMEVIRDWIVSIQDSELTRAINKIIESLSFVGMLMESKTKKGPLENSDVHAINNSMVRIKNEEIPELIKLLKKYRENL